MVICMCLQHCVWTSARLSFLDVLSPARRTPRSPGSVIGHAFGVTISISLREMADGSDANAVDTNTPIRPPWINRSFRYFSVFLSWIRQKPNVMWSLYLSLSRIAHRGCDRPCCVFNDNIVSNNKNGPIQRKSIINKEKSLVETPNNRGVSQNSFLFWSLLILSSMCRHYYDNASSGWFRWWQLVAVTTDRIVICFFALVWFWAAHEWIVFVLFQ